MSELIHVDTLAAPANTSGSETKKPLISIIIPYHNEKPKDLSPLMASINQQVGVNFSELEIILCSDTTHSPIDNYSFKEHCNIHNRITKIKSPTLNNPGLNRQAGIDKATGEYLIFCDADDALYTIGILREILENIKLTHADVYRYRFLEETEGFANTSYVVRDYNWIWMFSKIYRRAFLIEHNIRFSEELLYHEDNYFNTFLSYCEPKVVDINSTPMYLWRCNKDSITRRNNHEYTFNSIAELLKARTLAYRRVYRELKKDCVRDILYLIVREYLDLIDPKNVDREKWIDNGKAFYFFVKEFCPDLILKEYAPDLEAYILKVYKNTDHNFLPSKTLKTLLVELAEKFDKEAIHHVAH